MVGYGCFFLGSILCCSQSGDDPQEDLAKFGYRLNMRLKHPSMFLATYFNHVQKSGEIFFLNFGRIMAIDMSKYTMNLALSIFNIAFDYI
jgi:hypothetical protein